MLVLYISDTMKLVLSELQELLLSQLLLLDLLDLLFDYLAEFDAFLLRLLNVFIMRVNDLVIDLTRESLEEHVLPVWAYGFFRFSLIKSLFLSPISNFIIIEI